MNGTEFAERLLADLKKVLHAHLARLHPRLLALEQRAAVPGPKGDPGPRGDGGANGKDADPLVVKELTDRVGLLEVRSAADLSPEDVAEALADLFRKELPIETPKMQKRIVRDASGKATGLVEEAV